MIKGNISIASSWNQLNDWQAQEIAHLYLNASAEDFTEAYVKMILVVYQKSPSKKDRRFLDKLTKEVPISELEKYCTYLRDSTNFFRFPEISGLIKPADRIENITIRQFSTIDTFFYAWNQERSIINLKRLVTTLYRLHHEYDALDLRPVALITDKIPVKQMEAIALAYLFTRIYIENKYPIIFPKKDETEDINVPVFKSQNKSFVPFDKVITAMAMDELQPLGKKQDANNVRVYEFLDVYSESIVYQKQKAKAYERK